jgi:hypothetical protein
MPVAVFSIVGMIAEDDARYSPVDDALCLQVPYYAYLASLGVALYANCGTLWYVAAFGLAAAGRVYKSTKSNSSVPIVVLPAIAASGNFPTTLAVQICRWLGLLVSCSSGWLLNKVNMHCFREGGYGQDPLGEANGDL